MSLERIFLNKKSSLMSGESIDKHEINDFSCIQKLRKVRGKLASREWISSSSRDAASCRDIASEFEDDA